MYLYMYVSSFVCIHSYSIISPLFLFFSLYVNVYIYLAGRINIYTYIHIWYPLICGSLEAASPRENKERRLHRRFKLVNLHIPRFDLLFNFYSYYIIFLSHEMNILGFLSLLTRDNKVLTQGQQRIMRACVCVLCMCVSVGWFVLLVYVQCLCMYCSCLK